MISIASLKRRYIVIFALYLIVFIAINAMAFVILRQDMLGDTRTRVQWAMYEAREKAGISFAKDKEVLSLVSDSMDEMFQNEESTDSVEKFLKTTTNYYIRNYGNHISDIFGYIDGRYMSGSGYIPPDDYEPTERIWYKMAMEHPGEYVFSMPYEDLQTGKIIISGSVAIPHDHGVIAMDVILENFTGNIDLVYDNGITGVYYIDSLGNVIRHEKDLPDIDSVYTVEDLPEEIKELVQKALADDSDEELTPISYGTKGGIAFHQMLMDGWHVVMTMDNFFNIDVYRRIAYQVLFITLIILTVVVLVTVFNAKQRLKAMHLTSKLEASCEIYYVLLAFNLNKNTVEKLKDIRLPEDMPYYTQEMLEYRNFENEEEVKADEYIRFLVDHNVAESYMDRVLDFIDHTTLKERLNGKKTITIEFVDKFIGWVRGRYVLANVGEDGLPETVLFSVESIEEEKKRENVLRKLSETDGLTDINNRFAGENAINEFVESEKEGMFFLLDVDKFKSFNDDFGHNVGDKVLIEIAKALKSSFRGVDVIMRLGGDEFAAYAVGTVTEEHAKPIVERLFAAIDAIDIPEVQGRKINISLGATAFVPSESNTDGFNEIYMRADKGTYESKKMPGNTFTYIP